MNTGSQPRVLIVDDEAAQVKALCDTLGGQGYATAGFESARAALDSLRDNSFDILLSDLVMPEMDGITLLQAALKTNPNMAGIIMTGEGTIGTAVEAMKCGALDYLLKPFQLSAILPVLERALAVGRLRLENAALERQVRERTAQLESANEELEAFADSVSHDLRAPLRHIGGFAQMLGQSGSSFSEQGRHCLEQINKAAVQMRRLIEDLLEFSRLGRAEMRPIAVNLEELLDQVIQGLAPELEGRDIRWKKGPLPRARADPALLRQVFENLLLNAVKYSRTRHPAEIEIGRAGETAGEMVIFVRDNGVGFDMNCAGKLFGIFQRLHSQEEFEGTGVGLANVRRIIARHGGRTWAEGKVEGGATFYFSLPDRGG